MESSGALKQDMQAFQLAVGRLSDAVNKCGVDWRDSQFAGLSALIGSVASSSRQVVLCGKRCESAMARFSALEKM